MICCRWARSDRRFGSRGTMRATCLGARSQGQIPGLPDQVLAERVVLFLLDETEPGTFVDAPRRSEDIVGPKSQIPVALFAGEADALSNQALPQPTASTR